MEVLDSCVYCENERKIDYCLARATMLREEYADILERNDRQEIKENLEERSRLNKRIESLRNRARPTPPTERICSEEEPAAKAKKTTLPLRPSLMK